MIRESAFPSPYQDSSPPGGFGMTNSKQLKKGIRIAVLNISLMIITIFILNYFKPFVMV